MSYFTNFTIKIVVGRPMDEELVVAQSREFFYLVRGSVIVRKIVKSLHHKKLASYDWLTITI